MTDCERALELISQELDGPLTAEDAAWLEDHLAACPDCRALRQDLAALHQELPGLAARPPEDLKGRVMEAVRASKITPFQGKKRQWQRRSLASLAAVLALVFIGGYGLRQWGGSISAPAAGEAAPAVQIADGEGTAAGEDSGGLTREASAFSQRTQGTAGEGPEVNAALVPQEENLQATLTMDALPEGWQEALPGVEDPDGAVVPCGQARALADLLEEQGIASAVEGDLCGEGNCRILLSDK